MADLLAPTAFRDVAPPAIAPLLAGKTIAVARDAAYCFLYPANLDCLERLGAKLVYFSPLVDAQLPSCDAVWLSGGYPELHGPALAANRRLWDALAAHIDAGKPVLAECGGMMSLFETLYDVENNAFALAGQFLGQVRMQKKLAALGMQEVDLPEGRLRGHRFHYSNTATGLEPLCTTRRADGRPGEAVYRRRRLTASYMHLYFPSNPEAAARLFLE